MHTFHKHYRTDQMTESFNFIAKKIYLAKFKVHLDDAVDFNWSLCRVGYLQKYSFKYFFVLRSLYEGHP